MIQLSRSALLKLALAAVVASAVAGCGRRGPLEPHPDAPAEQRAKPEAEQSSGPVRPAVGGSRRTLSSPIPPPKKSIFLDAIL